MVVFVIPVLFVTAIHVAIIIIINTINYYRYSSFNSGGGSNAEPVAVTAADKE